MASRHRELLSHKHKGVHVTGSTPAADVARRFADRRVERLEERLHAQGVQAQERARLEAARRAEEAAAVRDAASSVGEAVSGFFGRILGGGG
jgi:hypothetical protein